MRTEIQIRQAAYAAEMYALAMSEEGCKCGCVDLAKAMAVSLRWTLGVPSHAIDELVETHRKVERSIAEMN